MRYHIERFVSAFICCALSMSVHARDERISVSQLADRSIVISLEGNIYFCDASLGGVPGPPTVTRVASSVTIISPVFAGECHPSSYVPPLPPPQPYTISTNIGVVADDSYTVAWSFAPNLLSTTARTSFGVASGLLVRPLPVPALSNSALIVLIALLLAVPARLLTCSA